MLIISARLRQPVVNGPLQQFHATGVTAYIENGGTLEYEQQTWLPAACVGC